MKNCSTRLVLTVLCMLCAAFAVSAAGAMEEQAAADAGEGYPMTFIDDLETEVTLHARPESVISLTSFSDEVLFELLPDEAFAAVSTIALNKAYSNVLDRASRIEPVIEFNVEQIISIYPDLVIAANWSEAPKVEQLRKAGIPVYQIDTPFDIEGIIEAVSVLGDLTGRTEEAAELNRNIEMRAQDLMQRAAAVPENERVSAIDYNSWATANGFGTTWDLVLSLAGIDNAVSHMETGDFGQVPLSKEVVIDLDPDILFLPSYVWGDDDAADAFYRQVVGDPALSGVKALREERVYVFPEKLKNSYSHFLLDAAETAARMAYPGYFE